jgi:hypothetical protein
MAGIAPVETTMCTPGRKGAKSWSRIRTRCTDQVPDRNTFNFNHHADSLHACSQRQIITVNTVLPRGL